MLKNFFKNLPKNIPELILFIFIIFSLGIYFYSQNYYIEVLLSFFPYVLLIFCLSIFSLLFLKLKSEKFTTFSKILFFTNIVLLIFGIHKVYSFYYPRHNNSESFTYKFITVNIWWQNTEYESIQYFFENQDADVLSIIEFTDTQYDFLEQYLSDNYPYSNIQFDSEGNPFAGNIIFSKYPFGDIENEVTRGYYSGYSKTEIILEDKSIELYLAHLTAPTSEEYMNFRNDQLNQFADIINNSENNNIIITGDFNITPWSKFYKDFNLNINSNKNYRNAAGSSGFQTTWQRQTFPNFKSHIDHTFISKDIRSQYKTLDFPGSDHDAQILEIK